ncbi:hypothetical protein Tdes44962_MAKER00490 [Teratosphaeria destructans]|uniref:Uncharacterized protein n=1 Tax=Teratosphaeria destructans TaxID=418781 RepID=A0A9W7SQ45_9PEZI|nr:hypothetical protein Tdes44962_MAKER00490 [Teratosphaeria destructans]
MTFNFSNHAPNTSAAFSPTHSDPPILTHRTTPSPSPPPAGHNIHIFSRPHPHPTTADELTHLRASRARITSQLERATNLNREMRLRCAVPASTTPKPEDREKHRCLVVASVVLMLVLLCSVFWLVERMASPAALYARRRGCAWFGLEGDC